MYITANFLLSFTFQKSVRAKSIPFYLREKSRESEKPQMRIRSKSRELLPQKKGMEEVFNIYIWFDLNAQITILNRSGMEHKIILFDIYSGQLIAIDIDIILSFVNQKEIMYQMYLKRSIMEKLIYILVNI